MEIQEFIKKDLGNTLIAGVGPAAIQIAVHLSRGYSKKIGLYNRPGIHADRLKVELGENDYHVSLTVQGIDTEFKAKISSFSDDCDSVQDEWDTLILSTPSHSYSDVMKTLHAGHWKRLKTIILISPNIGSNDLVKNYIDCNRVEVISMSTYYAATKFSSSNSVISAHTKTYKKRIYMASTKEKSPILEVLNRLLNELEIEAVMVDNTVDAECRNITTYVHPALFMNAFTLYEIFDMSSAGKKFLYKLYPEGPITQESIRTMVALWKEISNLVTYLGAMPINLLQFLNDDNYPVPEESLSREDIENYETYERIKQEYLLYIRYSTILIDPFSTPDQNGRYFEFSAVPFKRAKEVEEKRWHVPRIPFEDYQKLCVINGISKAFGLNMPKTEALIAQFELQCERIESRIGMNQPLLKPWKESASQDVEAFLKARGEL
ncbi:opine metallophore biosynthesis dehydrogenase [Fictibacillus sp. UD]|uniref:opine metallophore biosynthesis dehydrogenase n=1 Tax=Fictibacillus sp. UD TaxID=3038777 RepID=UPI0037450CED